MLFGMAKRTGAMHVAKGSKKYVTKDGVSRESVAYLLRRTYRDGVTVKHETLANLSALPEATLEAVRVSLTGQALVVPDQDLEVTGSRPHGHVAAVHAQAKALGRPALLGPAWVWPTRPPTRCTRRWTGSPDDRTPSRPNWSAPTWPGPTTLTGSPCTTYPPPG